jgi:hypothetical protein
MEDDVTEHGVPRIAAWLLACVLPPSDRDAVLGDLVEEHAIRTRIASGPTATMWFWKQVLGSIPSVLWMGTRRGAWLTTLGVAFGAYVVAGAIEFVGEAALARLIGPDARTLPILSAAFGLATIVVGGYVAALIRPGAATALAAIVMLVVATLLVTVPDSAPFWYGLTFLMVGPLAALAGGTVGRVRRRGEPL